MSQYDKIIHFRQTLLGGALVIGSGILFYIIFLFSPCGLGTNLESFDCLLVINILFPVTYGLFGVAWIVKYVHNSKTLVNFNLPELPELIDAPLDLPSEILLLTGKKSGKNYFLPKASWVGVPGAILCELILQKALILEGNHITPVGAAPLIQGNLLLNTIYLTLKQHGSSELMVYWFEKLNSASIIRYILERLTWSAFLQKKVQRIWGVTSTQNFTSSIDIVNLIKDRLCNVSDESKPVDIRDAILFALADGCSLLGTILSRKNRKATRRKVNRYIAEICPEINRIIQEMELLISLSEMVVV